MSQHRNQFFLTKLHFFLAFAERASSIPRMWANMLAKFGLPVPDRSKG